MAPVVPRKPRKPEAVLTPQHVCECYAEVGFARDACGLGGLPGEELIHRRAGQFVAEARR